MKRSHKAAAGIAAALSLGIAAAAFAQPGNESHDKAGMQHGQMGGMHHAGTRHGGMQHGTMGENAGMGTGHSLMTPEEHTALQEKMRSATTPEERHKLAEAARAEMQKRANEKGATTQSDTHTH